LIEELIKWLDFMIENQEEIKLEYAYIPQHYPDWNKGYHEALIDMKKQIDLIKKDIFDGRLKKSSLSVGNSDFEDAHYKGD
jgi:hypothetical protein